MPSCLTYESSPVCRSSSPSSSSLSGMNFECCGTSSYKKHKHIQNWLAIKR